MAGFLFYALSLRTQRIRLLLALRSTHLFLKPKDTQREHRNPDQKQHHRLRPQFDQARSFKKYRPHNLEEVS